MNGPFSMAMLNNHHFPIIYHISLLNLHKFTIWIIISFPDVPSEIHHFWQDTPGQIEVFNWSASGQIICDALAVTYPTVICYVSGQRNIAILGV